MAEVLPEELGQPTHDVNDDQTIDHDVELALGNVRTNVPVSSRLRSTRGHPISSGTKTLDQLSISIANRLAQVTTQTSAFRPVPGASGDALLRENSPPRTRNNQPQAFTTLQPTSTPNPSQTPVLRPKARYANAVLASKDIPPSTTRVLTLVPDPSSGTTMAAESVTPVNEHSFHDNDIDMNAINTNYDDDCRVEDVAFSVSIRDSQSRDIHIDEGCSIHLNDQPSKAENRSLIGGGDRPEIPRSPGMTFMPPMSSVFRPISSQNTPLHSRTTSRRSDQSLTASQFHKRTPVNLDWLGSVVHKVVDESSNMRQQSQIREQKLNDQALKLIQDAANKQLELSKQREEKQLELAEKREDKLRNDLYQYADLKVKAAVLEQQLKEYRAHKTMGQEMLMTSSQHTNLDCAQRHFTPCVT